MVGADASVADRLTVALPLLRQVGAALDAVHAAGLVHRDVKPGNILVTASGRTVLIDFGIVAGGGQTRLTGTGGMLGTPEYMAPEQVRGEDVGPASDLYAFGVVTFEILAGRLPFTGTPTSVMHAQVYNEPPSLTSLHAHIRPAVAAIVAAALAKAPAERFTSALAFVDALERADAGIMTLTGVNRLPNVRGQRMSRRAALAGATAGVVLLVGAALAGRTVLTQRATDREYAAALQSYQSQRWDDASTRLLAMEREHPGYRATRSMLISSLVGLATQRERSRNDAQAEALIVQAAAVAALSPTEVEAQARSGAQDSVQRLVDRHIQAGELDQAAALLDQMSAITGDAPALTTSRARITEERSFATTYAQAQEALKAGKPASAAQLFQRILDQPGGMQFRDVPAVAVAAWMSTGDAEMQASHWTEAEMAYDHARKVDPDNRDVQATVSVKLGDLFLGRGLFKRAVEQYDRALSLAPAGGAVQAKRDSAQNRLNEFGEQVWSQQNPLTLTPQTTGFSSSKTAPFSYPWPLDVAPSDFVMEFDALVKRGPGGPSVDFRRDFPRGYSWRVAAGSVTFVIWSPDENDATRARSVEAHTWQTDTLLSASQPSHIKATGRGTDFTLNVNGQQIASFSDPRTTRGSLGLSALIDTPQVTDVLVVVENMKIYRPGVS